MTIEKTGSPVTILVVDDSQLDRQLLSTFLIDQGHHVKTADDGASALAVARNTPLSLILMDVVMPGMNGYDACRILKDDEKTRDIPVIFISGLEETIDKVKAFSCGGVDFVAKPIHLEEVLARVETHLKLRRLQEHLEEKNTQLQKEILVRRHTEEELRISEDKLRGLSSYLLDLQEKERKWIADEMHEELGQALVYIKLQLSATKEKLPEHLREAHEQLGNVLQNLQALLEKVRRLFQGLTPLVLSDLGLTETLRFMAEAFSRRSNLNIFFNIRNIDKLFPFMREVTVYRVFQEALTNIEKHAQADQVSISSTRTVANCNFVIEDNGRGFTRQLPTADGIESAGLGLTSMEERIRMLGGQFEIVSQRNGGTRITFSIPVEEV